MLVVVMMSVPGWSAWVSGAKQRRGTYGLDNCCLDEI